MNKDYLFFRDRRHFHWNAAPNILSLKACQFGSNLQRLIMQLSPSRALVKLSSRTLPIRSLAAPRLIRSLATVADPAQRASGLLTSMDESVAFTDGDSRILSNMIRSPLFRMDSASLLKPSPAHFQVSACTLMLDLVLRMRNFEESPT